MMLVSRAQGRPGVRFPVFRAQQVGGFRRHKCVFGDEGNGRRGGARVATDSAGGAGPRRVPDGEPADVIAELYREHAVGLIRTALLIVGDRATAEDVVQDAFSGLHRRHRHLHDPGKAVPYLRTSVVNGCRSVLRARRRARLVRVQHEVPVWSAESAALAGEERREVLAAVARLSGRQREVLVLRYYAGLTDQEAAEVLGISRSAVSAYASRALAILARELRGDAWTV
jgi:RNA polymerase sigma-70 factor (sigma-E family)